MNKTLLASYLGIFFTEKKHNLNSLKYLQKAFNYSIRFTLKPHTPFILMLIVTSAVNAGVSSSGKSRSAQKAIHQQSNTIIKTLPASISLPQGKASASSILVKYKQISTPKSAMTSILNNSNMKVNHEFPNVPGLKRLELRPSSSTSSFNEQTLLSTIKNLQATGQFEYVEPDWRVQTLLAPSDTSFGNGALWGLLNTGQNGGVSGVDINVSPAWDIITGLPSITVGVVDTGIRYTHQDLTSNMWINSNEIAGNGIDDDANGYIDDVHGINAITGSGNPFDDNNHGTHVAGTIAATAFDSGQHVGVAYNVRLMALKFLDSTGGGFTSDAIESIQYATAQGVDILNNSWGGGGSSQALQDAIQAANDAGIVFVAAAGNSASNNDLNPNYPSNYDIPNVITVAAVDRRGQLASFSNYGVSTVDIAAPGVDILSTTATSDNSYDSFSGTSMATPHVAGLAALIMSQNPAISMTELKNRILLTARPLVSLSDQIANPGIIDAHASLTVTADGNLELNPNTSLRAGQPANIQVSVTDLVPVTGASVTGRFTGQPFQPFLDNGIAPDLIANDGIYTSTLTVPANVNVITLNVDASATGKNPASESFTLPVISVAANDNFADRFVLSAGTSKATGTNQFASSEVNEPRNPSVAGGKTVWWEWSAAATSAVTISTTGSTYDTTLAIYQGNDLNNLVLIGANDDASGLQSAVSFTATSGSKYLIQVDGFAGSEGDIELNYPSPDSNGSPIVITQPVSRNIVASDAFDVSVTATGQETLIYQWYLDNVAIPGATLSRYFVATSTESDSGNYSVEISNSLGSIRSNSAFIAINAVGLLPDNDAFANAHVLSGTSGQISGSNIRATEETGEPNHALVSAPIGSVWYSWTAPENGTLQLDTSGSDFDTTLAVYLGTSVNTLTGIGSNDNTPPGLQSSLFITVVAGETYRVAVDGFANRTGQINLNYSFSPDSNTSLLNDSFINRSILNTNSFVTGSNIGFSGETGEPVHAGVSNPLSSAWWYWTAPVDGEATFSTTGSDFDTTLAAYQGNTLSELTDIASNDDYLDLRSRITFSARSGETYVIAVDGFNTSEGSIQLVQYFIEDNVIDDGNRIPDGSPTDSNLIGQASGGGSLNIYVLAFILVFNFLYKRKQ